MSEKAYTPGPWKARFLGQSIQIDCQNRWGLAYIYPAGGHVTGVPSEEDLANARLIAAAPELLEALEAIFRECALVHKHWDDGSNTREADAAIAAATGAIVKAGGTVPCDR
jgi:hypothetical protein